MSFLSVLMLSAALAAPPQEAVLYDFRSDRCGPCRAMDPVVAELRAAGYPVRVVDVDAEPQLAERFGVRPIPCFLVVSGEREIARHVGKATPQELAAFYHLGRDEAAKQVARDLGQNPAFEQQRVTPSLAAAASVDPNFTRTVPVPGDVRLVSDRSVAGSRPRLLNAVSGATRAPATAALHPGIASAIAPAAVQSQLVELEPAAAFGISNGNAPRRTATTTNRLAQQSAPNDPFAALRGDLMAASVRLILNDPHGRAFGSGTIIDCREGEVLILTCGHIFREWNDKCRVDVDFFGPAAEQQLSARVILYNLKSDVGLLSVSVKKPVKAIRISTTADQLRPGEPALATGCEHGGDVAAFATSIRSLDKYLGPPNLQIAGQPAQGRSGGGLFNKRGELIGVCNAADKQDDEGLYAALGAIQQLLDRAQLSFVYQPQTAPPAFGRELERLTAQEPPNMPPRMPLANREERFASQAAITTELNAPHLPQAQFPANAAPLEPQRLPTVPQANLPSTSMNPPQMGAAEVICIVRPHDSRQSQGEVITLSNASPEFLARLEAERQANAATANQRSSPAATTPRTKNVIATPTGAASTGATLTSGYLPTAPIRRETTPNAQMSWPR